jgi:hypothetical protein
VPGFDGPITLDMTMLPMRLALGIGFWWLNPGNMTL